MEFEKEEAQHLKLKDAPNARADDEDQPIKLTWEDFNCSYNSICPNYQEVAKICDANPEQQIDLRPYM